MPLQPSHQRWPVAAVRPRRPVRRRSGSREQVRVGHVDSKLDQIQAPKAQGVGATEIAHRLGIGRASVCRASVCRASVLGARFRGLIPQVKAFGRPESRVQGAVRQCRTSRGRWSRRTRCCPRGPRATRRGSLPQSRPTRRARTHCSFRASDPPPHSTLPCMS